MSRRMAILLIIVLLAATLSGCWSRREINELGIVTSLGFDKTPDGKIEITVEVVRPAVIAKGGPGGGGGSKGKAYWIVNGTGETIIDAARNLNLKSPRRLFFAHMQVMVFGERLAREGLMPVMDRLSRSNEVRRINYMLVTPGRARDIIEAEPDIENLPSIGLRGLVERATVTSKSVVMDFKDFLADLASKSTSPVASKVEIYPDNRTRESWGGQGGSAGTIGGQAGGGVVKSVELTGAAVFRQDKLVGWLNQEESTGLLWIQGKVQRTITIVPGLDGKKMAIETTRTTSKLKPQLKGDRIVMTVQITQEGDIAEQMGQAKVDTPELVHRIDSRLAMQIKKQIEQTIKKAQRDLRADIFGFGAAVRRKYPKEWAEIEPNWPRLFPEVEVVIDVRTNIRRRNMTTDPPPKPPL